MARRKITADCTSKVIDCRECGNPMVVGGEATGGVCWRCCAGLRPHKLSYEEMKRDGLLKYIRVSPPPEQAEITPPDISTGGKIDSSDTPEPSQPPAGVTDSP